MMAFSVFSWIPIPAQASEAQLKGMLPPLGSYLVGVLPTPANFLKRISKTCHLLLFKVMFTLKH